MTLINLAQTPFMVLEMKIAPTKNNT